MKLLLVEDDKKIATAVERGLEAEGFIIEVAVDGDDGLWLAIESAYCSIETVRGAGYRLADDGR